MRNYSIQRNLIYLVIPLLLFIIQHNLNAQNRSDGCTTITAGKSATTDGSVLTSHTFDGHREKTWMEMVPAQTYPEGSTITMHRVENTDSLAMPAELDIPIGEIPQIAETYAYMKPRMACMNEYQLGIGESTYGGREELRNHDGLINLYRLTELIVQRCKTAREAIEFAGEITQKYGWNDRGECLTISDPNEVWHFEIIGTGKFGGGSVWAAQRVPDDHVAVNANASRIMEIDLDDEDHFMASHNVFSFAIEHGFWNPNDGEFRFCYAYDPDGRKSMASRRREWRVLSLLAPSLDLDPNGEYFPFSVKPEVPVSVETLIPIFQDYYENTPFNPVKNITWQNNDGEYEISPLANPFMPYDMNPLFKLNGGWNELGERTIARWYTIYATIIQCRDWLPDEIGGVVWFAWDNIATSVYVPLYCSITDVHQSYKTPGRVNGFTRESAWWAFNRLGTLTAQRWGEARYDVRAGFDPIQKEFFNSQTEVEKKALELYKDDPVKAKQFLTDYGIKCGEKVVNKAWELGDQFWTKYDEKF
ncbi:dipeptidase [Bacteroidota bacterium]